MVKARTILGFSHTRDRQEAPFADATERFDPRTRSGAGRRERTHLSAVAVRAAHVHGLDVERVHPAGPLPEPPAECAGGHPRRRPGAPVGGDGPRRALVLERPRRRGLGRVDLAAVHPARAPRARRRQEPRRRRLLLDPAVVHRAHLVVVLPRRRRPLTGSRVASGEARIR